MQGNTQVLFVEFIIFGSSIQLHSPSLNCAGFPYHKLVLSEQVNSFQWGEIRIKKRGLIFAN